MIESLVFVVTGLLLLNGWMYLQQPSMTFFPDASLDATPADQGLDYQDVQVTTADGVQLHGWYIPAQDSTPTVLFLHGNAGNISHRGESVAIFHQLGLNVLIFDYRGYGHSEGSPSETGLYEDARAAWSYLTDTKGVAPHNIIIFGRSLGGVVAAQLASQVQPGALILESTFSSGKELAQSIFPLLSRLVLLRYHFDTAAYVKNVHSPVLVLHSRDDDIVPFELGEKVYQAANPPRSFVELRGDHNNGFLQSQPGYQKELGDFIGQLEKQVR